jgi:Flp pilus assembly protein TadB
MLANATVTIWLSVFVVVLSIAGITYVIIGEARYQRRKRRAYQQGRNERIEQIRNRLQARGKDHDDTLSSM